MTIQVRVKNGLETRDGIQYLSVGNIFRYLTMDGWSQWRVVLEEPERVERDRSMVWSIKTDPYKE